VSFAEILVCALRGAIFIINPKNVFHVVIVVSLQVLYLADVLYISEGFMLLDTIIDHALLHLFCLSGTCTKPFLSMDNCFGEMALEPVSDMRKRIFWLDLGAYLELALNRFCQSTIVSGKWL
jgi:hypothetical protein